jgi:hypothetical protein
MLHLAERGSAERDVYIAPPRELALARLGAVQLGGRGDRNWFLREGELHERRGARRPIRVSIAE